MNKKALSLLLVCILPISALLAGCAGNGDEEGKTIKVWAMGEEGKKLDELAKKFEEENPDINVDVQAIPWGQAHDKLLTAVASGGGPDVVQLGTTWVSEFASAGALLDLSEHMEDYPEFKPENYFDGAAQTMKYDGKVVGIPWYVETRVLYYRSDLLEEVGYSEPPATWEEMKDAATKLSERGDKYYGLDIDIKDQITPFIFAWQNGFEFKTDEKNLNLDSQAFTEAMEYYTSFFKEGLSTAQPGMDIVQAFKDGVKPMFISGPWMVNIIKDQAPDLDGKWSVAVMPKKDIVASAMGGSNFSIFESSENVEESLKFISFMNEVETQVEWYEISNTLPSRVKAWEDPVLQEDPMIATFGKQLETAKASPQIENWEVVAQELLAALERVTVGGADLEKELDAYREKVKEAMSE
ncbi:sugar ABC transporter substrate-binding protein [Alkalihalobacillus sp. AL-G]|uniref:sugar ABC transporter substrate-binding protein n=1 Tax=Alkalihalobacillus sp. AL-G TaxID=2926399 RepID=UPI00272CD285|nr:sugar ABC transporter substrate-binding protein [Alkalihalobacillus sp. AL-G]WLD92806.1 sugar ABC transporter substrate-binding protein [Alkalihalobacillus sp. AL-G]